MNCSRQDWHRALDFSAVRDSSVAMSNAILKLLRRRQHPVHEREIASWFRGTPDQFISATLGDMVEYGQIRCRRTSQKALRLEYYIPSVYCPACSQLVEFGKILEHGHGLSVSIPQGSCEVSHE